jgi:hypothetical protein
MLLPGRLSLLVLLTVLMSPVFTTRGLSMSCSILLVAVPLASYEMGEFSWITMLSPEGSCRLSWLLLVLTICLLILWDLACTPFCLLPSYFTR